MVTLLSIHIIFPLVLEPTHDGLDDYDCLRANTPKICEATNFYRAACNADAVL